jgi:hypothetical protein
MGGLGEIHRAEIRSYAHVLTCDMAKKKNLPVPKVSFKDSLTIKLADKWGQL